MNTLTSVDSGQARRPAYASGTVPGPATASRPAAYTLPAVAAGQRGLARAWLWLAPAALGGSGVFSVVLVVARTPGIHARPPAGGFFPRPAGGGPAPPARGRVAGAHRLAVEPGRAGG